MKQTPEATPVFVHIYGTIDNEGKGVSRMNRGNVGTGNCVMVSVELAATLHRTQSDAETYRKITGGIIVPTTTDKLSEMFPRCDGAWVVSPKEARDHFFQSTEQDRQSVSIVVPYKTDAETHGIKVTDTKDCTWFDRIDEAIGTNI
jgi:hypothetical protein